MFASPKSTQESTHFDVQLLPNQFIGDRPHMIGYMDDTSRLYVLNPATVSFDPLTPAHERHETYRVSTETDIGTVQGCALQEGDLYHAMQENSALLTQDPAKMLSLFRVGMMFDTGGLIERVATISPAMPE